MRSIKLRSGLTLLILTLVSGYGSEARGQFTASAGAGAGGSGPEGSSSLGGTAFTFSDGVLHSLTLESQISIQEGVSPGFKYVTQSSLRGRRYAFLCVIEHAYQGDEDDDFSCRMQTRNSQGSASQWFLIKDVICRLKYEVDNHSQKKLTETMAFGLQEVDLQQGRVFYIDLSQSPARVTQLPLQLPKSGGGWRKMVN